MQHVKEGVTPEQINALIDAETWKNGEEWQEFFDIEVTEKSNAEAFASDYFDRYNHLPEMFKKLKNASGAQMVDVDRMAEQIAERLKEKLEEKQKPKENENKEEKIAAILEDLDLI